MTKKTSLLIAVVAVGLTLALNFAVPQPGVHTPQGERISRLIPYTIGAWISARDLPVSPEAKAILGTDDILHRVYESTGEADEVLLTLVFSGGHRHSMHPPEVCYQSQGYKLIGRKETSLPNDRDATALRLSGNDGETLVNYWFYSEGKETSSYMRHQVHLVMNQITFRTQPSVLLRLSTKILTGDQDQAQARLERFAEKAIPVLREKLSSRD